jgi:hypothetical protein
MSCVFQNDVSSFWVAVLPAPLLGTPIVAGSQLFPAITGF